MRRAPLPLLVVLVLTSSGCELGIYGSHDRDAATDAAPGPDGCTPLPEICDGRDNDCDGLVDDDDPDVIVTDPANCGACGNVCALDHVEIHTCPDGECEIAMCVPGYTDYNQDPDDGCESDCVKSADYDFCDGLDNDCNGVVDDGYDLDSDPNNCGACGFRCEDEYPLEQYHVIAFSCVAGACAIAACEESWWNADGVLDDGAGSLGCEYPCQKVFNVEICNGVDDDCDGVVDNQPVDEIDCLDEGVCAGSVALCGPGGTWSCSYETDPDYQVIEDDTRGCDGLDNDCDGRTDEAFGVGQTCYAGQGACREAGEIVCTADETGAECDAVPGTPGVEICDGLDNDCDGVVDQIQPAPAAQVDAFGAFVYVSNGNFTIFAHEASRAGATAGDAGFGEGGSPCSLGGVLPWTNISHIDLAPLGDTTARAACQRLGAGWDLCTDAQWYRACADGALPSGGQLFPYGAAYQAATCNGFDYGDANGGVGVRPTGSLAGCFRAFSGESIFDLSGNVKEIVRVGATSDFAVRGGAYNNLSIGGSAPALQCTGSSAMPTDTEVRLPSIGFRCCYGGNLFQ